MQVYKIAIGSTFRFVRACNAYHARLIAYTVWKARNIQAVEQGQQAPDIGRAGYDRIVNSEAALFIVRMPSGKVSDRVSRYYKAQRKAICTVFNPEYAALFAATK